MMIAMTETGDNSTAERLELVFTTNNLIYLEMIKEALGADGIPAIVKSAAGYHARGMLPFAQGFFDYRLYVSKENLDHAMDIVNTIVPPEDLR